MAKTKKRGKKMPESLSMKSTLFADGARGMRLQMYENQEFGVRHSASLPSRNEKWIKTWMSDLTGEEEYESFAALRAAYNALLKK